jgi:hypothetical protein
MIVAMGDNGIIRADGTGFAIHLRRLEGRPATSQLCGKSSGWREVGRFAIPPGSVIG